MMENIKAWWWKILRFDVGNYQGFKVPDKVIVQYNFEVSFIDNCSKLVSKLISACL